MSQTVRRPGISSGPVAFRLGDHGRPVADIRARLARLGLVTDGRGRHADDEVFDERLDRAVREFQQQRGLTVDGVMGPGTFRVLDEASWRLGDRVLVHSPGNLLAGDDVFALQRRLLDLGFAVGKVDGRFGSQTERALREFQRNVGVPADGTCGPATLKALSRLSPIVRGGNPNAMRAEEQVRRAGPQLTGKIVAIDPCVGLVSDPELRLRADAVSADLARRIEGRLVATGVQAFLTNTGGADDRTEVERAEFANRTEAHLTISLQVDTSDNPDAAGVSTYYYGTADHGSGSVTSPVGERFAGLVQREIVARTDLADLRSHPKTWDLLLRTRMPAVRIDVGYLTNAGDAARLADPAFRDVVAEAVVVAVQRVYLGPDSDTQTGVLRLSELREAFRNPPPHQPVR